MSRAQLMIMKINSPCSFYDCETTGFSIYTYHIIDIAAKVIASPVPVNQPSFSSLVQTPRNIPGPRKIKKN